MLPRPALEGLSDLKCLAPFVESRPLQAQRFTLPDAEREGDDEPHTIALAERYFQQAVDILCLEGLHFLFVHSRRLREFGGIPWNAAPFKRLAEGRPGRPVHLMGRASLEAAG
jgi:hypothetical protein